MDKDSKIYVSGHTGLVGHAVLEKLEEHGYRNIITRTSKQLNLLNQAAVDAFFAKEKPEYVIHLAAKVGGIVGNKTYPAEFYYENEQIQSNVIHAGHLNDVKKLLFMGSVCVYPRMADIPIKEEYLLTGPLEQSNEGYAVAKISGLMMCKKYYEQYGDKFFSTMPANLYGPNDNYHQQNAHVIPMLMERFHQAKEQNKKEVVVWGTGKPTRDFLHSFDLAEALILLMNKYEGKQHINIGPGVETTIRELAETLKKVVGFKGELKFDTTKPDGTPRRYLDNTKINNLGWKPKFTLEEGLTNTYKWFLDNKDQLRRK